MSLQDVIRRASEDARRKQQEQIKQHYVEYHSSLYSTASAYDNAIVLAGYAAFFALWAGTADDLPRLARLITVALMGIALMAYVAVTIGQMLLRQYHLEFKRGEIFANYPDDPEKFIEEWEKLERTWDIRQGMLLRPFVVGFWIATGFGFAAAIMLTYNALGVAFGWPVLAG